MVNGEKAEILQGLGETEAAQRLREEGYNELPLAKPRSIFTIILTVLSEPMLALLLACSIIYFFLGDSREAFILHSIEGFSVEEIAAITSQTAESVLAFVMAAREHLRKAPGLAGRFQGRFAPTGAA